MIGFSGHEIQRLRGIALLELGFPAPVALDALVKVSEGRGQYSLIDRTGTPAAYTAPAQFPWRGSRTGVNYACGANTMVGPEVVRALGDTFEATEGSGLPSGGASASVPGGGAGNGGRQPGEAVGGDSGALETGGRESVPGLAGGRSSEPDTRNWRADRAYISSDVPGVRVEDVAGVGGYRGLSDSVSLMRAELSAV